MLVNQFNFKGYGRKEYGDLPETRSVTIRGRVYWRKIRKVAGTFGSWFGIAQVGGKQIVVAPIPNQMDLDPRVIWSWEEALGPDGRGREI